MSTVKLVAVGDIMLGESPQVFGSGVASMIRRHGPHHPFEHVKSLLQAADIAIGNLEVAIASTPADPTFDQRTYRGDPASVEGVASAGFDVLSVCTNHMMQHGQAAFEECIGLLVGAGIAAIGAECSPHGVRNLSILERQGMRIGFLAFNFRPDQYTVAPPAWLTPTETLVCDEVARIRADVDVVVLSLHWGDEFIESPSPEQVRLAHRFVDSGADVVLGHHPHIVQGVERYRGAVVAYSLGNFVYDQWQERLRRSMVLRLSIRGPRDIDCEVDPMMLNARCQPIPCSAQERRVESAFHAELSELLGKGTEEEYRRRLSARFRRFRKEVLLHYILRFWTFAPGDFLSNLAAMIRRRV